MRILIVASHYPVCSARYMAAAFRRQGHEVRHVGPAMGREIWGVTLPPQYEWKPDEPMAWLTSMRADWANVVIVMDSDPAILDDVARIRHANLVVYGVDNHVRDYRRDSIQHYFLAHYHGPVQPVTRDDESWLPCAYDPVYFRPSPIPFDARDYDVALLGVMYPERKALADQLHAAGFKVIAGTGIVYESYAQIHQNARIALCINANDDLAQRWFESAAMGCHVLGTQPADLRDEKTAGVLGLAGFSSIDPAAEVGEGRDIVFRVRNLLGDAREDCKAATLEMQQRVQGHTWDARARTITDWVMLRGLSGDAYFNPLFTKAIAVSGDPYLQHAFGLGLPDIEPPGMRLATEDEE